MTKKDKKIKKVIDKLIKLGEDCGLYGIRFDISNGKTFYVQFLRWN